MDEYHKDNPEAKHTAEEVLQFAEKVLGPVLASQLVSITFPRAELPLARLMTAVFAPSALTEVQYNLLRTFGVTHLGLQAAEREARERLEPAAFRLFMLNTDAPDEAQPAVEEMLSALRELMDLPEPERREAFAAKLSAELARGAGVPEKSDTHLIFCIDNFDAAQWAKLWGIIQDPSAEIFGQNFDGTPEPLPAAGEAPAYMVPTEPAAGRARAPKRPPKKETDFFKLLGTAVETEKGGDTSSFVYQQGVEMLRATPALGRALSPHDGDTALGLCVRRDCMQGVRALLWAGAPAAASTERRWTALHSAALAENVAMIGTLLDAQADPNAVDADGRTPLSVLFSAALRYEDCDEAGAPVPPPPWARSATAPLPSPFAACLRELCHGGANCALPDCSGASALSILLERAPMRHDVLQGLLNAAPVDFCGRNAQGESALHIIARAAATLGAAEPELIAADGALTKSLSLLLPAFGDGRVQMMDRPLDRIAWDRCPPAMAQQPRALPPGSFWDLLYRAFHLARWCLCRTGGCTPDTCQCTAMWRSCFGPPPREALAVDAAAGGTAADTSGAGASAGRKRKKQEPQLRCTWCTCGEACNHFLEAQQRKAEQMRGAGVPFHYLKLGGRTSQYEGLHYTASGVIKMREENIPDPWRSRLARAPKLSIRDIKFADVFEAHAADELAQGDLARRHFALALLAHIVHTFFPADAAKGSIPIECFDPFVTLCQPWRPSRVPDYSAAPMHQAPPNCYENIAQVLADLRAFFCREPPNRQEQRADFTAVAQPTAAEQAAAANVMSPAATEPAAAAPSSGEESGESEGELEEGDLRGRSRRRVEPAGGEDEEMDEGELPRDAEPAVPKVKPSVARARVAEEVKRRLPDEDRAQLERQYETPFLLRIPITAEEQQKREAALPAGVCRAWWRAHTWPTPGGVLSSACPSAPAARARAAAAMPAILAATASRARPPRR